VTLARCQVGIDEVSEFKTRYRELASALSCAEEGIIKRNCDRYHRRPGSFLLKMLGCMVSSESISGATRTVYGHLSRIMYALQRSPAVSYVLDSDLRILYCNPAWNDFARSNGAPELASDTVIGFDLFDAIPEELRALYSDAFRQVFSTGRVWEQSYECSSPVVFRVFRMRIHLLKPQNWCIVTNPLVVERPHTRAALGDAKIYVNADGFLTMCAHCRCSRRQDDPGQWDFVPEYLQLTPASSPKVSHGLCPVCRAYFYRVD